MKILAIGNSFSVDAMAWLPEIAENQGVELTLGNLCIGGCSLETHDANIREDKAAYEYYKTGREVKVASVRQALEEDNWDVVTLQQASHYSGQYETYQPFLSRVADFVRRTAPGAKIWIHETWAYEAGSDHPEFGRYLRNQSRMYEDLRRAYTRAAAEIGAEGVIPCGTAMQIARGTLEFDHAQKGLSVCRDGFHASLTYGRYLLGLVWLETLTGADARENTFAPHVDGEDECSEKLLDVLRGVAHSAVEERKV